MADKNYIIQLSDNRQLSIPQQYIQFYPTINNIVTESPFFNPEHAILLLYDDSDALYKVFTTPIQQESHTLDMYVRLSNAIDYLGNDDVLNQFMTSLVAIFNDRNIIESFKADKEHIKETLRNLNN